MLSAVFDEALSPVVTQKSLNTSTPRRSVSWMCAFDRSSMRSSFVFPSECVMDPFVPLDDPPICPGLPECPKCPEPGPPRCLTAAARYLPFPWHVGQSSCLSPFFTCPVPSHVSQSLYDPAAAT